MKNIKNKINFTQIFLKQNVKINIFSLFLIFVILKQFFKLFKKKLKEKLQEEIKLNKNKNFKN